MRSTPLILKHIGKLLFCGGGGGLYGIDFTVQRTQVVDHMTHIEYRTFISCDIVVYFGHP